MFFLCYWRGLLMFLCDLIFYTFVPSNVLIVAFSIQNTQIEKHILIDNVSVVYIFRYTYNFFIIIICLCVWNFSFKCLFYCWMEKKKWIEIWNWIECLEMFNMWYVWYVCRSRFNFCLWSGYWIFRITDSNPHILKTINVSPPQKKSTGKCNNNFFYYFFFCIFHLNIWKTNKKIFLSVS